MRISSAVTCVPRIAIPRRVFPFRVQVYRSVRRLEAAVLMRRAEDFVFAAPSGVNGSMSTSKSKPTTVKMIDVRRARPAWSVTLSTNTPNTQSAYTHSSQE